MQATTSRTIAEMYAAIGVSPELTGEQRDAMHKYHLARARCQIRNALLTDGMAVSDASGLRIEVPAACSIMLDLALEPDHQTNVHDLKELARLVLSGAPVDQIGAQAILVIKAAVDVAACLTADSLDEGLHAVKRFVPGSGV